VAASPATDSGAPKLKEQLQVSLQMCQLEETFAGAIKLKHVDASSNQPLRSIKLSSNAASKAAAAAAAAASAEGRVRAGRPLSEVIAAANAQLAGRYQKQVAAGLKELSERLSKGAANSNGSTRPTPPAPPVSTGPEDDGLQAAQQAPVRTGSGIGDVEQAGGDAEQDDESEEEDEEDVYATLSLLRRLLLWPVKCQPPAGYSGRKEGGSSETPPQPNGQRTCHSTGEPLEDSPCQSNKQKLLLLRWQMEPLPAEAATLLLLLLGTVFGLPPL